MNNLRLLKGLFHTVLLSCGVCANCQTVLTLEQIFESAEANSRSLRPSITSILETEREISVARSGRLPDINANLSLNYMGNGFTTQRDFSDVRKAPIPHLGNVFSVGINQPVYTGGAVTNAIELAELKSTASRYAADFRRDNIRFQLTGFYLDIYRYTNLRRVVEGNIKAARKVLEDMRSRYEQGTALLNDITRYELLVSGLELQLVKISNTIDILNTNLVTIAGLEPSTKIIPDSSILIRALPVENSDWWQREADLHSPTLHLAQTSVDMTRKSEDLIRSERLPKIGLRAFWSMEGPILVEVPPINRNLSYWYVGVGIDYNLSSLYKSNKSLARSRLGVLKAREELESAKEALTLAVNEDYIHYLESYEELKTQEKNMELAERNYRTTATRYSVDMALITDMLDAANARLDAGQSLVNARINIIYYYYKLLFTTGKI